MKAGRDFRDYLLDIVQYSQKAERMINGLSFEEFYKNEEKILAGIQILEVIGEACKNLPATVKNQHPEIPWKDIAGMRDKLIHSYFSIDAKTVWRTLSEDLPPLNEKVEEIIKDLDGKADS
jgi:uncharacterized protein with HEPN domain